MDFKNKAWREMDKKDHLAFSVRVFVVALFVILVILAVKRAWPAEISNQEDYILTLAQAENWSVAEEAKFLGIVGRVHQNPNNQDQQALVMLVPIKDDRSRLELFAKVIFLKSVQRPRMLLVGQKAALKKENGEWVFGDYIRANEARIGEGMALAFRLLSNDEKNNPLAIRVFLLKELMPKSPK